MAHISRFFLAHRPKTNEAILEGAEAHHALHVMRVRPGDVVWAFDGAGTEWQAEVASADRRRVVLKLGESRVEDLPRPQVTLACGGLHRDASIEQLLRWATPIGVNHFIFFEAEYSQRTPKASPKWRQYCADACKQCGRLWLPQCESVGPLAGLIPRLLPIPNRFIALGGAGCVPLGEFLLHADTCVLIGPEGGFSPGEMEAAQTAGFSALSLGSAILRTEVAAVAAATLLRYEWGQMGPHGADRRS